MNSKLQGLRYRAGQYYKRLQGNLGLLRRSISMRIHEGRAQKEGSQEGDSAKVAKNWNSKTSLRTRAQAFNSKELS